MQFVVYPGGPMPPVGGTGQLVGAPDDPTRIAAALADLSPPGRPIGVRCYVGFRDEPDPDLDSPRAPARYAAAGHPLDLVMQYQSARGDVDGFVAFVRQQVRALGPLAATIQVGEEPNAELPMLDGTTPRVAEALAPALPAARAEVATLGLSARVGFNFVPSFGDLGFFEELRRFGGATL